jgi:ADP-heptose:LPS heptosyltransferase
MEMGEVNRWLAEGIAWRRRALRHWYIRNVASRLSPKSSALARRAYWPLPWTAPYLRPRLHLARKGALGDVLMCTPTLMAIKRLNPSCRVTFYTQYTALLKGLSFIDDLKPYDARPPETIELVYEHCLPPPRHIAQILGEVVGLRISDTRPACAIDPRLVADYSQAWNGLPRPRVVVNRHAGPWTPNKAWPSEHWRELVKRLALSGTAIEIGLKSDETDDVPSGTYISLVGQASLAELIAAVAAADVLVSPVTGPVHIAAAAGVPAVVIYGGYEHPVCSSYPGNINLYSPISCAPCWLRTPCPIGGKCLRDIQPDRVEQAVARLSKRSRHPSRMYGRAASGGSPRWASTASRDFSQRPRR